MRGAILLTLVVVLGLVCVCCKGTDVKKSPEGSLLLDIDPKVANAPGDDKKKPGPENDPHGWRWRFRYRKGYRRRRYPSRRPYPPHHTHPPPPPTPATSVPCSSSRPDGVQWANEWTKSLDFECPKGKAFTHALQENEERKVVNGVQRGALTTVQEVSGSQRIRKNHRQVSLIEDHRAS